MPLTHEQETALAKRTMHGDKSARDEFITANIPLVVRIARHYIGRGMDLEDLTQEGMFGCFLKLASLFAKVFKRKFKFST